MLISLVSMEEQGERELQLLLPTTTTQVPREVPVSQVTTSPSDHPQLDLDLSMSIGPKQPPPSDEKTTVSTRDVQVLKQQTADQIRLASAEKAYAERVRELAKRELELAEKEFARARLIWERAREEVEKVERMKEIATRRIGSAALEITCHACMQCFHP